jgi:acyl carrier protein
MSEISSDSMNTIGAIWADTLGVDRVAPDDNFFSLGGDSVMVTIMAMQVEQALDIIVSADIVFDHPTLEAFTAAITAPASA